MTLIFGYVITNGILRSQEKYDTQPKQLSCWNNQDSLICCWLSRFNTGKYIHELTMEFLPHACATETLLMPKFKIY